MTLIAWIQIPITGDEVLEDRSNLKYAVNKNATIIYHGQHAYVSFMDEADSVEFMQRPGIHLLTPSEVHELDRNLPFPFLSMTSKHSNGSAQNEEVNVVGLGDLVARFTRKLGIQECDGCRKRKRWLNRVTVWRR